MALSIVYLDDEIQLGEIFREFVESDAVRVHTFTEAHKAIDFCHQTPPEMAFIDFRLSDTTGIVVAKALDAEIFKVLVTGELVPPGSNSFDEVISKPFKLKEIQNVIARYEKDEAASKDPGP